MKGHKSDTSRSQSIPPERHDYSPPPASAAAYIPPTQAPKESKYHTLDLKAVRLAPEIDPQRMKTQMALRRVPKPPVVHPSMWVSLCLAGAALGLGAWWCVQWWREQGVIPATGGPDTVLVAPSVIGSSVNPARRLDTGASMAPASLHSTSAAHGARPSASDR